MIGRLMLSFAQLVLEPQAAHARKPHVQQQAPGLRRVVRIEEFLGGAEGPGPESHRARQLGQAVANGFVVIHNEDCCLKL